MDLLIQMLPERLRSFSTHHDFQGQKKSERLLQIILVIHGVVGFLLGYFFERMSFVIGIILFGAVVASIVVLPPWPVFRRHPLHWQPKIAQSDTSSGATVNESGATKSADEKPKKNTKKHKRLLAQIIRLRVVGSVNRITTVPLALTRHQQLNNVPLVYLQRRFFSNSRNDDEGSTNDIHIEEEDPTISDAHPPDPFQQSPSTVTVPDFFPNVPIIAINRFPLFPGFIKKVDIVKSDALKELIRRKVAMRQGFVGVFVKKNDENQSETVSSLNDLHNVGTFAQILEMRDHGNILELVLNAQRRIRLLERLDESNDEDAKKNYSKLNGRRTRRSTREEKGAKRKQEDNETPEKQSVEPQIIYGKTENLVMESVERTVELKAQMQAIVQSIRDIVQYSNLFAQQINLLLHPSQNVVDNPVYLCDLVATLVQTAETADLQQMMEETKTMRRCSLALELLEKEKTVAKLKHDINKDVEKKVQEQHRKYLLNEQLKAIKKELGIEKDDKQTIIEKLEDKIKDLKIPEYALKVIKEEQNKLNFLDPHSSEFSVSRNYLDWLCNVPWGKTSEENLDLHKAETILNEDHYGMKDVKDRILEFIAVASLKKAAGGKILCFHGPPGVGKTSIARSIARALNRQYFRFSVGGMVDVAEIKGHRRTYIGAMPGKMVQCLKKVQTENPLVLIDEVDKIGGAGYHGDPASALLELLDPEQNANFMDHFLDVPIDLSKVLFICTANVIDTIPGALRDRMELIEVSGYVAEEKLNIAQKYLIPQCRENCALTENELEIRDDALDTLIKHYCRESGVRNLQKHIEKIFRKAAYQLIKDREEEKKIDSVISVHNDNLRDYVGREKFTSDRLYDVTPPGVIMGLAWTAMGGSALYIEASLRRRFDSKSKSDVVTENGKQHRPEGSLEATGHLGDVMKESMRTAYTVAKNQMSKRFPDNEVLELGHVHVHVPEGATPKDGPSAGCTIVSALLSLGLNHPAKQNIAMTGEISLTGKVMPVGGIREKIIAAKRSGVNTIILPAENKKEFDDLADFIKADVTVHFVNHYDEVFDIVFPDVAESLN
ncbi:Lon protease-like protein, mitochondrial [Aphelenchoides besseyi]|nr:Lon protease-like protein, mitochondrial [Aphelenchoides besseyi]KAI6208251.1 Lon protease-like protein, mitochondrial [Aphelenchoides besseyi]